MARPDHVSAHAARVLDVLERHTMFPWPLLKTQAERAGLDPAALTPAQLHLILDDLEKALARFTSAEKAALARRQLLQL